MDDLFRDAKLKIKRANKHIEDLRGMLNAFLQTEFYRLRTEHDVKAGEKTLKFELTKSMPEDVPLFIGDAMQNLRTVLDYMAFEIVTRAGGSTDHVKFPVREDRKALEAALKGGEMKVAGSDIINLICDVVQPYPGGKGATLYVLHNLNITDKHLRLIPVISAVGLKHVNMRVAGNTFIDCTFGGRGTETNMLRVPAYVTWQGNAQQMFEVLFGKGDIFEGQAVIPTLEQLSKLVGGTLQAIEQVYLARGQGAHTIPRPDAPSSPPPP
jgi:hypothetical protein